jgi:hypothetical protein
MCTIYTLLNPKTTSLARSQSVLTPQQLKNGPLLNCGLLGAMHHSRGPQPLKKYPADTSNSKQQKSRIEYHLGKSSEALGPSPPPCLHDQMIGITKAFNAQTQSYLQEKNGEEFHLAKIGVLSFRFAWYWSTKQIKHCHARFSRRKPRERTQKHITENEGKQMSQSIYVTAYEKLSIL